MCAFRSLQFSAIVFAVFSRYSAIFYNFLPFPVTLRTSLYLHNFKFSNKFYSTSFNNPSIFSKSSTNNSYKQKWNNFIISNDVVVIVQYNILKITFKIILHTFLIFYLFYAENLHKKKKKNETKCFSRRNTYVLSHVIPSINPLYGEGLIFFQRPISRIIYILSHKCWLFLS